MRDIIEDLRRQYHVAKSRRRNFDIMWQDITDYVMPYRGGFTKEYIEGEERMQKIFDSTAPDALEVAASGVYSNSVNPSSRWLHLQLKNRELMADDDVKKWLNDSSELAQSMIDRILAMAMIENFMDWLGYGMAALFINEEDDIATPFSGTAYPLKDIYAMLDYKNQIRTVFRKFRLSYNQAVEQFGDKLPATIRERYEKGDKYKDEIRFLHCVTRRSERDITKKGKDNMPWASYYICRETFDIVDEGGYEENPYIIPRFSVIPGETYGRGPMTKALPVVRALNQKVHNQIDASNLAIRPPMDVPEDAYITPLRLTPGARNINQNQNGVKATPITAVGDINFTLKDIQEDRENIRRMMYNDLLKLPLQDRMTTLEVDSRRQEQLALLAPFLVRLEQEYFTKIVERVMGILFRKELLPPAPQVLEAGTDIEIVYDSPLARSMKHANVQAIDGTLAFIGTIAQFSPEVLDNYDFDAMARGRSVDAGLPLSYLKSSQDVNAARGERQQQQQQQVQAEQQQAMMQQLPQAMNQIGNTPGMEQLTASVADAIQQGVAQAGQEQAPDETMGLI